MKFSRVFLISGILLASISLTCAAKGGKVYTWTDSKGVVHYGEHPPKDVQAKLVKTRTGYSEPTPTPSTTAQATPQQGVTTAADTASLKDAERCNKAQENLNILNSGAPVRTSNEKGERVIMSEEEKDKQRNIFQLIVNQAC